MTWEQIREQRNQLLKDSDWTALPDAANSIDQVSWLIYRAELRNLPQSFANADDVVFPEPPKD